MLLGTEIGLRPGDILSDGDPAPHDKGHSTPTFRPMSIVAKRWPISATAERLYYYAIIALLMAVTKTTCKENRHVSLLANFVDRIFIESAGKRRRIT